MPIDLYTDLVEYLIMKLARELVVINEIKAVNQL